MSGISIVWPEGQPERAVLCRGWLSRQWRMLGPMGLRASARGRRMCFVRPVNPEENPIVLARLCERHWPAGRFRA